MLAALLVASVATLTMLDGADLPLVLDWSADESCPTEAELRHVVESLLVVPTTESVHVSGRIGGVSGGGWELDLELHRGVKTDHHRVRSSDCDELGWLAAQLIANTIDPFGLALSSASPAVSHVERVEDAQEVELHQEPIVVVPSAPVEERHPEPPLLDIGPLQLVESDLRESPRRAVHALVSFDALGLLGTVPGVVPDFRLGLAFEVNHARVLLAGGGWTGGEFRSATNPEVGGDVQGWSTELGGCGLLSKGPVDFPLCARVGAGQMFATGVNVQDVARRTQPWVWTSAEASLEWWPHPSFALTANIGVGASLVRPAFVVTGSDAGLDVPIGFARFGAGIAGRFVVRGEQSRRTRRSSQTDRRAADRKGPA